MFYVIWPLRASIADNLCFDDIKSNVERNLELKKFDFLPN